jgi:hypothetical protein
VRSRSLAAALIALGGCGGAHATVRPPPTLGGIAGLARDHDSGEPVAHAQLQLLGHGERQPHLTATAADGRYDVDQLRPGRYDLAATFAGQRLEVTDVEVHAGDTTLVDLTFTLGQPAPIKHAFGDAHEAAIDRYRPPGLAPSVGRVEGAVADATSRARIVGAVVTVVGPGDPPATYQAVTDDSGHFRFDALPPAEYAVSAYYSVDGHGQIEVRRSGITLAGGEAVIVPLWIETAVP